MTGDLRHVLVITTDKQLDVDVFRRLTPALAQFDCEVHRVPPESNNVDVVEKTPFDLLVVGFPMDKAQLRTLLKSIRWKRSACRRTPVLLVTNRIAWRRAEVYLEHGVNRIVSIEATDSEYSELLSELLRVQPRVTCGLPLWIVLPTNGRSERVMAQIDNVSRTGMLVRGRWDPEPGTQVTFEFTPPGSTFAIRGTAEVVRRTLLDREATHGFGVRFMSLEGDGMERLAQFVTQRRGAVKTL